MQVQRKPRSKYHNTRRTIGQHTFDSVGEGNRYIELLNWQDGGDITALQCQQKFILIPKFNKNGKHYREIAYIADFTYLDREGKLHVEDFKGMETDVFKLKRKLFEHAYPELTLEVVKNAKERRTYN